jgi:hypothetical protein
MRKCKCGNEVANNAKFCPKCGHRFTSSITKFVAWMFVVLFGLGMLGAIIGGSSSGPVGSSTPVSSAVAAPAHPAITTPPKPKTPAQIAADAVALRKAYAKVIDQQLIEAGIESKTYTNGAQAKTMVIEDVLAGRVRANEIGKNSQMFEQLRALGFTKLLYTDGFESLDSHQGFTWDLGKK